MINTPDSAALLAAVAAHLDANPELAATDVYLPDVLYLNTASKSDRAPALLAWARSLDGECRVEVRNAFDAAHVEIHSELDGHPVSLRSTIPGLAYLMGDDAFTFTVDRIEYGGVAWITLSDLAAFVEHGTTPQPVDTLTAS